MTSLTFTCSRCHHPTDWPWVGGPGGTNRRCPQKGEQFWGKYISLLQLYIFVDNFVNWNIKDIFTAYLGRVWFFFKIALKKPNADLNRWQYIRNHYICGHACRDTGLYQLIYHLLLRSYHNTFNLRFYKRVSCYHCHMPRPNDVGMLTMGLGLKQRFICWRVIANRTKKKQTNWTIYNLINCTSHRSISMKQYLSLLFDNLSEKGRNIFFIIRKNDVLVHTIYHIWWCRIRSLIY